MADYRRVEDIKLKEGAEKQKALPEFAGRKPFVLPFKFLPTVYRHMFNFAGRTSRMQVWVDTLVVLGTILATMLVLNLTNPSPEVIRAAAWAHIYINGVALTASYSRRLRDAGYPAWSVIIVLIPIAGIFLLLWRLTRPRDWDNYQKAVVYSQGKDLVKYYEEYN